MNDREYGTYFTSDYPVAIETFDTDTPINRIVPLAPDLAVRIVPDLSLKGKKPDLSFPGFTHTFKELRPKSVMDLNRKLVNAPKT